MTIDCHSALDLLGQKYISAIFCYDAYVFPHTLNFSITCSQTKVLFISQHYKPFVWIFMLTFTYINQTLLKTLFSSCKSTAGMTVIPALPKTVCFADGFKARRAQRGGFLMIKNHNSKSSFSSPPCKPYFSKSIVISISRCLSRSVGVLPFLISVKSVLKSLRRGVCNAHL